MIKDDEAYCQPCVSPVWDTALVAHALLEAGGEKAVAAANKGLDWLKPLQVLDVKGDWIARRPNVRPGGWAFQYNNAHYPDLDDTAVVVMAMDRARGASAARTFDAAIDRAREWIVGLQSHDGGFGAFDADNDYHYLNNIPFADHGALLDPPTADLTARCLSMLAQLGERPATSEPMRRAIAWLERDQLSGGKLVRPLGHELHLRHLVGAVRAQCGRRRSRRADGPQGGRLARSRSRTRTAAGARTARATSSTTAATRRRRARRRKRHGPCLA